MRRSHPGRTGGRERVAAHGGQGCGGLQRASHSALVTTQTLDSAIAAVDAFIANMVTDPRRLRAIALDSPGAAAEIQARAAELSLPRQVLDPSFDPSFARLWVASLDDTAIAMVHRVMAEELRRRDSDSVAPRRMGALAGRG